jgi:hypothetical protein
MAAFARPDNLMKQLKSSGLFKLGVDSSSLFWEIVNATWTNGSATGLGYKKVMQARICELLPEVAKSRQPEIRSAVFSFVDAYIDHSQIDEHWRSILQKLSANKSVRVIIATDHYAEATNAIINYLGEWQIKAAPLTVCGENKFVVANSADIGAHKAERRFWDALKVNCGINVKQVLLIDDFGAHEQSADAQVKCLSFVATETPISNLISQVSAKIRQFSSEGNEENG